MERNLPEISHEINIVTLTSDEKNKGLLDPLCDYEKSQRFWITGYWYSDILMGFPLVMGNASQSLEKPFVQ